MRRMWTGPGPVCATGGLIVMLSEGSAASGSSKAPCAGPCSRPYPSPTAPCAGHRSYPAPCARDSPALTASSSVSVRFQKLFQKCTSRFCVILSNSTPRSSGSMANFPEFSPKETRLMAMVWRKGRMEGANCRAKGKGHCSAPRDRGGGSEGHPCPGAAQEA
uniref:Secreted protein n=1 Tax=Chelonoidis abingdonii TaxID=106734 RepID=A0A8C0G947_CHEAB